MKIVNEIQGLLTESLDPEDQGVAKKVVDALNKKFKKKFKVSDYNMWLEGDIRGSVEEFSELVDELVGDSEEQFDDLVKKLKVK